MNNTIFLSLLFIIAIFTPKTSVPCQFTSTSYNRKYRPTILIRKAWREYKNAYRDILANLSRNLEHYVEALRNLLKGVLPFKTIIIIPSLPNLKNENLNP